MCVFITAVPITKLVAGGGARVTVTAAVTDTRSHELRLFVAASVLTSEQHMYDGDASWPQWPQQSAEFSHGTDGFGDPERAHKLVYRIHENKWERVETMVLFPLCCSGGP